MGTLFKIVRKIIGGIARVLSFLLVSVGLWLPLLYTVAFFVFCSVADRPFSGSVSTIFWIGLGFTAMLGIAVSVATRNSRTRKAAARAAAKASAQQAKQSVTEPKSRRKRIEEASQQQPPQTAQPSYTQGYYPYMPMQSMGVYYPNGMPQQSYAAPPVQPMYYAPPQPQQQPVQQPPVQSMQQPVQQPAANAGVQDYRDLEKKYFDTTYNGQSAPRPEPAPARYERTASFDSDVSPLSYGKTMTRTQEREADDRLGADELWRRLSGVNVPDEQPLVFRTRRDSSLYVYEYADRYQYWRRTEAGMVLERTEYKNDGAKKA